MLQIYNFYLFDRRGTCLYYHEWVREHNPLMDNPEEDRKLVFGLLFSLKQLGQKLTPGASTVEDPLEAAKLGNVTSFSTNCFTLHQFETASGLRFVLNTNKCKDHILKDVQTALRHVYSELYCNVVVKDPLYRPGQPVSNPLFAKQLDRYIVGMAKRFA